MTRMVVVTPGDALPGFGLAGVSQRATSSAEVEAVLRALIREPETGVIVLDERLLAGMAESRLHALERGWRGLLLILPAPTARQGEGPDYVRRLLQQVLGYQVRLER